jgi:hypothetical protein
MILPETIAIIYEEILVNIVEMLGQEECIVNFDVIVQERFLQEEMIAKDVTNETFEIIFKNLYKNIIETETNHESQLLRFLKDLQITLSFHDYEGFLCNLLKMDIISETLAEEYFLDSIAKTVYNSIENEVSTTLITEDVLDKVVNIVYEQFVIDEYMNEKDLHRISLQVLQHYHQSEDGILNSIVAEQIQSDLTLIAEEELQTIAEESFVQLRSDIILDTVQESVDEIRKEVTVEEVAFGYYGETIDTENSMVIAEAHLDVMEEIAQLLLQEITGNYFEFFQTVIVEEMMDYVVNEEQYVVYST